MDQSAETMTPADYTRAGLLQAPSPFVFGFDDALEIDSLCSVVGVVLTIAGVILTTDCELHTFEFTHAANSNRTIATTRQQLGPGWLLRVRVVASSATPNTGQCFVWIRTCRGLGASSRVNGTITSGYLTATSDLFWPGNEQNSPLEGVGAIRSITGAVPAAGADISEVVPAGARWRLLNFFATLTTAVAVANRVPMFVIDDGVHTIAESSQQQQQAASLAWDYLFAPGDQSQAAGNRLLVTSSLAHDVWLAAGYRLRTNTLAIQAADQWTAPQYQVIEWLEGA